MAAATGSALCWLEAAAVRAAQESLGWPGGGRADRSRGRSAALVRACKDRLSRVVAAERGHDLNVCPVHDHSYWEWSFECRFVVP